MIRAGLIRTRLTQPELGADCYATSAYKWSGPHVGAVVADPALLDTLAPDKRRRPRRGIRTVAIPDSAISTHIEQTWLAGQQRAADRWKGLSL